MSGPRANASQRDPYAMNPEDQPRAVQMKRAWDAYNGRFRGGDEQWPLLWVKGKEPNPNVIINRCGPAVDTDVAWLMGESVSITLKDAPAAAQEYIDQAWGVASDDDSSDDDKMTLLQELATNGAVCGTTYIKIVWDSESGQEYPQLVVLDSQTVRVQTDPHNCKIAICYIIEYRVPDPKGASGEMGVFRQVIRRVDPDGKSSATGIPDDDTTWEIQDYFQGARATGFEQVGPPVVWPYSWSPVEGCPHITQPNRYYGRPRITPDVIHVNEAICAVASNINKIGMRHGHPILFTVKQGSNQRSIRHEPGTILEVSSDVKAVEAHGDLANLMKFEQDLRADFDEETHVPAQAFGRIDQIPRVPQSGIAIRLGYGPLIADITKERRTYGALIRRVTQHMLELKNAVWANITVTLGWQDPLPADDLQQAQVVQAAVGMGVMSKQTAADKMNLEWDVEQANMQEEQQDALAGMARGMAVPLPPPGEPSGTGSPGQPGIAPHGQAPPINHPAAVMARQNAQMAAGHTPTPGGM